MVQLALLLFQQRDSEIGMENTFDTHNHTPRWYSIPYGQTQRKQLSRSGYPQP
jgi:hypothetical protein